MPENNETIKQIIADTEYCADLAAEIRALVRLAGQQIEWSRRNVLRGLHHRAEKQIGYAQSNLQVTGSLAFDVDNTAQLIGSKAKRIRKAAPGS